MSPARLECPDCGRETPVEAETTTCQGCGTTFDTTGLSAPSRRTERTSEKGVQLAIKRMAQSMGFHVTDTSQPHTARITPGVPDLYLMHPEWELACWVEVKGPDTPIRKSQEAWHGIAKASGVYVTVARSPQDVVEYLKEIGAEIAA